MVDPEAIKHKLETGDITHADIYALLDELRTLIEEIEKLRTQLEKEEYNRKFGM